MSRAGGSSEQALLVITATLGRKPPHSRLRSTTKPMIKDGTMATLDRFQRIIRPKKMKKSRS